ncbi:MAG: ATP-grasp domain-containing protein, partial [Spirochaetaceae bacterium]|nr:ATP-grasp domain-containing protein [Spirochaetaceae bacterium]
MKKRVLILGAGFMQKPAITAAKKLGWYVAVADGNPLAVCASLADRFEPIDLKDTGALIEYASRIAAEGGLDGVFTAGTDFSRSVALVAEALSLPSHSSKAALNATDKIRMRRCFAEAGVPSPVFTEFDKDKLDALTAAVGGRRFVVLGELLPNTSEELVPTGLDFPLVVKPVDSMGARGCRRVDTIAELIAAIKSALAFSRTGRVIVEQYLEGPEFSVDALVCGGDLIVSGFADRHIFFPPCFIEMGHTMPSALPKEDMLRVMDAFSKGVQALGLTWGAAKGDLKLTPNGPMIGEIAARLSGGYMSGWTYPASSGVDLTEEALRIAVGEDPRIQLCPSSGTVGLTVRLRENEAALHSAERAWISIPGKVRSVSGYERAKAVPFVRELFPRTAEGDSVVFPSNNVEKCGNIIACAPSREEAVTAAETAVREIFLRLEPGNAETDAFLEGGTFSS